MFCKNCGNKMENDWKICPFCNTPVEEQDLQAGDSKKQQSKSNGRNSKKFRRKKIPMFLLIIGIVILGIVMSDENAFVAESDGVSENESVSETNMAMDEMPIYSTEYVFSYLESMDVKVSADKKAIKKAVNMDKDMIYVKKIGEGEYAATAENTEFLYTGELKDNKPHGVGKLMKMVGGREVEQNGKTYMQFGEYGNMLSGSEPYCVLVYMGEFEKGYYSGYGWKFITPFTNSDDLANSGYGRDLGMDYVALGEDIQQNILDTCNPIEYMGEFKKGKYNGEGVKIQYNIRMIPARMGTNDIMELFGYRADRALFIDVGEFKKGIENGKIKEYSRGKLYYSGEVKNRKYNGKGTIYYEGTDQIKYEGEWRSGEYHGKGTFHDEDGEVIYKGKWDMGDYAS